MTSRDEIMVRGMLEDIADGLERAPVSARTAAGSDSESTPSFELGFVSARAANAARGLRAIILNYFTKVP